MEIGFAERMARLGTETAFEVLANIWCQLSIFQSACPQDAFLSDLTAHLENQLVAAGLVLAIQVERLSRP